MISLFKSYFKETSGATAIEYGLIAAGIAVAIAVAVFLLGDVVSGFFSDLPDLIDGE